MARAPKASPKKSSPKASTKSPVKKPVKKVVKAKKVAEDAALNQRFIESLVSLEKYWSKKVVSLKKQLESLQAKHEKASKKGGKSAKSTPAYQQRQDEIALLKQELASAKLAASKFTALSKKIEQFEREWLKKLSDDAKAKAAPAAEKKKSTKTDKQSEKILKNKIAETAMPHFEPEAIEAMESADTEEMDDLEDIFMPQDDISEFEVIEDFSVAEEDDLYDDYNN
ncbi:MAG: hypothetical protein HYX61_12535 [Gammaproteobacteria bacterium]|nr:hypothetical protein [Gammaproteobacteria bacterium]